MVASLNYLTESLYESLVYYERLEDPKDYKFKLLPLGNRTDNPNDQNLLPTSPDDENFKERTFAKLKRYVVENCIYGVDINPTAVELARLSLWIETMDKNLPFEFLDHKIKTGNSLVGAWLDTFQEYPLAAWLREGGDKNHNTSVNYEKGGWTKAIKDKFDSTIKLEMVELINLRAGQLRFDFMENISDPIEEHKTITQKYNELHKPDLSIFGLENKAKLFNELLNCDSYKKVKLRMDLWCAIWFWSGDKIEFCLTPKTFYKPTKGSLNIISQLSEQYKFFHWEIEFPDVFNPYRQGFDAVVGNPPWEINKPNSKEFFSNLDPIYRTYGKQEALNHQQQLFENNATIELSWLYYNSYFKGMSNYVKNAAYPFGDPGENEDNKISLARGKTNIELHKKWKIKRKHSGYAENKHPFRYQGSADLNTYKMFLEYSYATLKNSGRLGIIVPSGTYSDKGTHGLRNLFINKSRWEWLYSFENKEGIFAIHRSYKFNLIIVQKGSSTDVVNTAFMQHNINNWEEGNNIVLYDKDQIKKYSPNNLAFLEIRTDKDAEIIEKIYNKSVLLGEKSSDSWNLEYTTEFHMTNDSKHFVKMQTIEKQNYYPDLYGRWINENDEIMYPLYQGVMIWHFDFSAARYISGAGNRAKWTELGWNEKTIYPQFFISSHTYENWESIKRELKLVFRDVSGSTNQRTAVSTLLEGQPCGNVLAVLTNKTLSVGEYLMLCSIFNSFVYDYIIRQKMVGSHLSLFFVEETPLLKRKLLINSFFNYIISIGARLALASKTFTLSWIKLREEFADYSVLPIYQNWALTEHERLRLRCILDTIIAELYGLDYKDFAWIVRDDPSDPKGFWRVDKDKPKELRQTTLTLQAFKRLKDVGLDEFIKEDWQFTEEIQKQLGPRFLDWQLQVTPEESWAECEYHAKQILGEEGFKKFMEELDGAKTNKNVVMEKKIKYGKNENLNLFD